ncbi:MAG: hypothetical protein Q8909_18300, partial [Bacteroidota bacterium]|nr:hypothetical protein [Bacteroidota bacterium]
MKHIYLLISTLIILANLSAQSYQAIHCKRKALYQAKHPADNYNLTDYDLSCTSLSIDSVKRINGDSVFYPHPVIQNTGNHCYTPEWSWIGKKVI